MVLTNPKYKGLDIRSLKPGDKQRQEILGEVKKTVAGSYQQKQPAEQPFVPRSSQDILGDIDQATTSIEQRPNLAQRYAALQKQLVTPFDEDLALRIGDARSRVFTTPASAREKYANIENPFARERLVSQARGTSEAELFGLQELQKVRGTGRAETLSKILDFLRDEDTSDEKKLSRLQSAYSRAIDEETGKNETPEEAFARKLSEEEQLIQLRNKYKTSSGTSTRKASGTWTDPATGQEYKYFMNGDNIEYVPIGRGFRPSFEQYLADESQARGQSIDLSQPGAEDAIRATYDQQYPPRVGSSSDLTTDEVALKNFVQSKVDAGEVSVGEAQALYPEIAHLIKGASSQPLYFQPIKK